MALSIVFGLIGLVMGGLINVLADELPVRERLRRPHCPRCGQTHSPAHWLAISQRLQAGACPNCGLPTRRRALVVEIGTALVFATLPWVLEPGLNLVIYATYVAVLILVIVIDLEHRLILHVVTFPTIVVALVASVALSDNSLRLAAIGAVAGFLFFYLAYLIGQRLFGPGALGFGDVTLAMTMGAMLGFHRIFFALVLGILLGGVWSLVAMASGRMTRRTYFAYGPFLAIAGIVMIVWGNQVLDWYTNQ